MTEREEQNEHFALLRECTLVARKWRKFYDARIAAHGLTAARASVLYWLSESGEGLRQVKLASLVGIEGPTLVRLLHALENSGYVRRASLEGDRRAKSLVLTNEGHQVVKVIRSQNLLLASEALTGFSATKAASALRSLRLARHALERIESL